MEVHDTGSWRLARLVGCTVSSSLRTDFTRHGWQVRKNESSGNNSASACSAGHKRDKYAVVIVACVSVCVTPTGITRGSELESVVQPRGYLS